MAKGKIKITERDLGFKKFKEQYQQASKKPYVKVGVLESAGAHTAEGGQEQLTVAQVATFNEFGTERIPQRSFLRSTVSNKRHEISEFIGKLKAMWLVAPMQALGLLGQKGQTLVKQTIDDFSDPPNTKATIDAKGSSHPLIDTGQMRNSIAYQVEEGGKK